MRNIFQEDHDPGMRFEGLLRAIFNCDKAADPWGYAQQEVYADFVPEPQLNGKRALSTGFIKLICDNPNFVKVKSLIELENKIWESKTQEEISGIIEIASELIKEI
jgi:hypothetical protein